MVIDDSTTVRRQVSSALLDAGFEVLEATDGLDGLDRLRHERVDLVLCDVNMPRLGGLAFLEGYRRHQSPAPVVMLTTEGEPAMVARARGLGAKGWIVKPFKTELLVAAARKLTAGAP